MLDGCAEHVGKGGALEKVIGGWLANPANDPQRDWLPIRLQGGLHRLALDGRAPELAMHFPSCGGKPDFATLWQAVDVVLEREQAYVTGYLANVPQTNETGRSALLLGGFLTVAAETGLPLRLLELGCSAGLNLFWDRYRTVTDKFRYGPEGDTLELTPRWDGAPPPLPMNVRVASRRGVDRNPVNIRDPEHVRRLQSYVWPEQLHRLERLRRAVKIAAADGFVAEQAEADQWIARELTPLPDGQATVVFHSMFWVYLDEATRGRIRGTIEDAGKRASKTTPLAWLRMENEDASKYPLLTLTTWPGGQTRELAVVHYHDQWVTWKD
jgi:hypothetical protein